MTTGSLPVISHAVAKGNAYTKAMGCPAAKSSQGSTLFVPFGRAGSTPGAALFELPPFTAHLIDGYQVRTAARIVTIANSKTP
jgi:hypothetical protein